MNKFMKGFRFQVDASKPIVSVSPGDVPDNILTMMSDGDAKIPEIQEMTLERGTCDTDQGFIDWATSFNNLELVKPWLFADVYGNQVPIVASYPCDGNWCMEGQIFLSEDLVVNEVWEIILRQMFTLMVDSMIWGQNYGPE